MTIDRNLLTSGEKVFFGAVLNDAHTPVLGALFQDLYSSAAIRKGSWEPSFDMRIPYTRFRAPHFISADRISDTRGVSDTL